MTDHIRIEELYLTRSLAGLDPAEAEELGRFEASHGEDCPECARLRDEYQEVAGRLAFALPPARVPAGMEDRILGRARSERSPARFRRATAAIAAALLLGVGALGGYLLAPRAVPGLSEAAAYLSEPGVAITNLEGSGAGNLVLAFHPGGRDAYLIGSNLARAPQGQVYELWLMRGDDARPAAVFVPDEEVVAVRVDSDLNGVTGAAVTLERAPGARKPTRPPIFAGPLTTV